MDTDTEWQPPAVDADLRPLADEAAVVCGQADKLLEEMATKEHDHDPQSDEDCAHCGAVHQPFDEPTRERYLQLEKRLRTALHGRSEQVVALEAHCNYGLLEWLSTVIFDLADVGRGDEALAMHAAWTELAQDEHGAYLGNRALLLLRAGRPEQARAAADKWLATAPEDLHALAVSSMVYEGCGDLKRAESLSRRYYKVACEAGDFEEKLAAGFQLADVLRALGQNEEADTLEQSLESLDPADE